MRKLFIIILGVLFLIPLTVKADMGPPEIKSYKVTPISKNGAKYYDFDMKEAGVIKYGTVIEITYEYKKGNVIYGQFNSDDWGYVNLSEFEVVEKQEKTKAKAIYVAKVFNKKGIDIYSEMSLISSKVGQIPYDADIIVSDYIENSSWLYVEYGDLKGFVEGGEGNVGILTKGVRMNVKDGKVYNEFYKTDDWTRKIIVKDGDSYKTITDENLAYAYGYVNTFKAQTECIIYKYPFENNNEKSGKLSKGSKIEPIYSYGEYGFGAFYVETENVKGWIKNNDSEEYSFGCFDTDDDMEEASDPKYDEYVKSKNVADDKDDKNSGSSLTPKTIIMLSCVGGAVIVLTALVIIILVNKKKTKSVQE